MSWNKTHSKSLEEKVKRLKEANSELRKQIKLLQSNSCLKDKDEEIKELGEIVQQYLIPSKNYDAIIKAKDEEIERLKDQLSSVHNIMYRNGYSDAIDCYDTFGNFNTRHKPNAKARSIVAMLFWEWRKSEARIYATNIKWKTGRAFQSQILFEAAYKILKEQQ